MLIDSFVNMVGVEAARVILPAFLLLSVNAAFFGAWAIARRIVGFLYRRELRRCAIPKTPVALWGKKGN